MKNPNQHGFSSKGPNRAAIHSIKLGRRLGAGAHSDVYEGALGDKTYAIKIHKGSEPLDLALQRFRREAAVHAGFTHEAIPQVYEVGLLNGRPYIITQLIDGPPLADRVLDGPLPQESLMSCALTLADALAEVHARGIVHRDIKPGNVLLDQGGHFHLIDFGLAGHDEELVGDGAVGTLRYCAPEQLGILERPIDRRSDLYALGAVLYECASGNPPFPAADINELLHQQAALTPPRLDEIMEGSCSVLADLIDKLLRKEPDERYQTADALLADLQGLDELKAKRAAGETLVLGNGLGQRGSGRIFVGREAELARLTKTWERIRKGKGSLAILEGAPGGGKSHLLTRFVDDNLTSKSLMLRAKCAEGDPFPLAPIRSALQAFVETAKSSGDLEPVREAAGELSPLLFELGPELAAVLEVQGASSSLEDGRELFYNAVASFILNLAIGSKGGLLLIIDDIQWLDDASLEVLRILSSRLDGSNLLIILASRNDEHSLQGLAKVRTALKAWLDDAIKLNPLKNKDLERLVAGAIGRSIGREVTDLLVSRSQGNPLALWQYIEVMKEEGVVSPHWGTWAVDREALAQVQLPTSLYDLMAKRLQRLDEASQRILSIAAFLGDPIRPELLVDLGGSGGFPAVQRALAEGVACQLIEALPGEGGYTFVHDRLREALLGLLPKDVEHLHRGAVLALEKQGELSSRSVFSRAHHAALGYGKEDPLRAYQAVMEAAELANKTHAYAKAYELTAFAASLGIAETLPKDQRLAFYKESGKACYNTERVGESAAYFETALAITDEPTARAHLRVNIARGTVFTFNTQEGVKELGRAFDELSCPLPSSSIQDPAALMGQLMSMMQAALQQVSTDTLPPELTQADRETKETIIDLCESGFLIGYYARDKLFSLQSGILALVPSWELGDSSAGARGFATFSFLMGLLGKQDQAKHFAERALSIARRLNERQTIAVAQSTGAIGLHLGDWPDQALKLQEEVFRSYGAWMGPIGFQNCCVDLIANYGFRGNAESQLEVSLKSIERMKTKDGPFMAGYICRCYAAAMDAAAALGHMEDARNYFDMVQSYVGVVPPDRAVPWITVAGFTVGYYLHQGELGAHFEAAIDTHNAWNIDADKSAHHSKHFYIAQAYGRLRIYRSSKNPKERALAEAKLRVAATELSLAAKMSVLKSHSLVLEANIAHIDGESLKAMECLNQARALATDIDNPWALYEEALTRAYIYRGVGKERAMNLEVERALSIARHQNWRARMRLVEANFDIKVVEKGGVSLSSSLSMNPSIHRGAAKFQLQRKLDGLLSLARASVRVLDPHTQAGVALDECARLLGAERAYLFVTDEENEDTLVFARGRGPDGEDIPEPQGYSRSIVKRVLDTKDAVLLSTTDDAREVQAESVVAYGLRSVLAAPLLSGERIFGVLYLDNRLVRGIFDHDHVDVVLALGQHITAVMQHARAAQLESTLRGEMERRRLAELLRELNSRLTSTLQLKETLPILTDALRRELSLLGAIAAIFTEGGGAPLIDGSLPGADNLDSALPTLLEIEGKGLTHSELIPWTKGQSALAIPLRTRDTLIGVALLIRDTALPFDEGDIDMATTLVGQAGIAIENARLFRRVKDMAERDELTGLYNRREFFRRANIVLEEARAGEGSFSALIFDVDHFKRFNDTYGHAVGDDVLKLVSSQGQAAVRDEDLLCRYGGEEFVVLLPQSSIEVGCRVAERIRLTIANTSYESEEHGSLQVTVSVGVTTYSPGDDLTSILGRADEALYQSKEAGRNTVTLLQPKREEENE